MKKELNIFEMSNLQGAISNSSCMIMGGLTLVTFFMNPVASAGIAAGAAAAGCFE